MKDLKELFPFTASLGTLLKKNVWNYRTNMRILFVYLFIIKTVSF